MNHQARKHWRRLRRLPGLGLWLVALALATALYLRQERGLVLTGYAQEVATRVAPVDAGRLRDVLVTPDQTVVAGQVVAWLDDTDLRLELAVASAELRRLRHEVQRETAGWALDLAADRRRFTTDVEETRLDHLEARALLAAGRVQLAGFESALARTRSLAAEMLASTADLEDDSVACEAQRELVRGQAEVVAALATRQADAQERLRQFADASGAPAASALPAALAAAVEVQEARLQLAELAQARCGLRAPIAGVVGEVLRQPGEVVAAGEPVVTILGPRALEVVAYAPEERAGGVVAGKTVRLRRGTGPGGSVEATVASVGAALTSAPARTATRSSLPIWGLAVRICLPEGFEARPGESFQIAF